jgi:hypothetical protein
MTQDDATPGIEPPNGGTQFDRDQYDDAHDLTSHGEVTTWSTSGTARSEVKNE